MKQVGLIIQGPVISKGRNFESAELREFNCKEYIESTYEESLRIGCKTIVVTWEDPAIETLRIPSEDVVTAKYSKSLFRKGTFNDWNSSKYKQFYLLLLGVMKLKERNCDYLIKIRTDQKIDLQTLISYVATSTESEDEKILTLFADDRTIDHWVDFVFGSSTSNFEKAVFQYMNSKELFPSIHRDFFYRLFLWERKFAITLILRFLLPYKDTYFTRLHLRFIEETWKNAFRLMPLQILKSLHWRGSAFNRTDLEHYYGADEFEDFLGRIANSRPSKCYFPLNLLALDALTICFPGNLSISLERVLNGASRRLKSLTRERLLSIVKRTWG